MERQEDAYFAATGEAAKNSGVVDTAVIDEKHALSTSGSHDQESELEGYIYPTKEELGELRRVSDTINWGTYSA